jgi:hypothetical protein
MPPPRCPGSQAGHGEAETVLPLADPTGVIQQALGGFPVGCNYGQQVILAWLMTLPEDINRAQAARSLLAAPAAARRWRRLPRKFAKCSDS